MEDNCLSYFDFWEIAVIWVKEVIGFTGHYTRHAENNGLRFFDPSIADFLRLLTGPKIGGQLRCADQIDGNFDFKKCEAPVQRLLTPGMHQGFQGAQGNRGTCVDDRYPGLVPPSWILGSTFATEGDSFFGVL